jgi:hypothetical protein
MTLYYSPDEIIKLAFETAGFKEFKWVPLILPEETPEREYWSDYMAHPAVRQFVAYKLSE